MNKVNFGWESEKDKLLRYMRIPPMKKLEWLLQMNEFNRKFFSKRQKKNWWKVREAQRCR